LVVRQNASEGRRKEHEHDIINVVCAALVNDEAVVCTEAAQAFNVLQENLGVKAIGETIPTLLQALQQPGKGSRTALQASREVMSVCCFSCMRYQILNHLCQVRATTIFPVLIPTLTAIPMTVFNT
jgi:hypothetical protein